jgi:hypothetical protein
MSGVYFFTVIFGLFTMVDALLHYQQLQEITYMLIVFPMGLLISFSAVLQMMRKSFANYITGTCSLILMLFFGYTFGTTLRFFPALQTLICAYLLMMSFVSIYQDRY